MTTESPLLMFALMFLMILATLLMVACAVMVVLKARSVLKQVAELKGQLMPRLSSIGVKVSRIDTKFEGIARTVRTHVDALKSKGQSVRDRMQRTRTLYRTSGQAMSAVARDTAQQVMTEWEREKSSLSQSVEDTTHQLLELMRHPMVHVVTLGSTVLTVLRAMQHEQAPVPVSATPDDGADDASTSPSKA